MGAIYGISLSKPQSHRAILGVGFAVLIGQSLGPTAPTRPELAMTGQAGARVAQLCGLSYPKEYVRFFDRANVLDYWPGPAIGGEGDCFPMEEARAEAAKMTPLLDGRLVVLCGRQVGRAFLFSQEAPLFAWRRVEWSKGDRRGQFSVAVAPHPSGVSRWWNKSKNVEAARAFYQELVAKRDRVAL